MLAEAIRHPGERMYIAGFGLIGLVGAAVASVFLWDTRRRQLRRRPRRQLRALHQHHPLHHRHADDAVLERRGGARRAAGGRVLRADAVRDQRHDADGGGDRPAGDLPGARSAVAGGLRADRAAPRQRQRRRGGVQVLPARRVLERVLPLRHRVRVLLSPGSTRLDAVAHGAWPRAPTPTLALLAVGLLAVGFCFKVSAVPFHMWTPDAYEGRADDRHRRSCPPASRRRRSPPSSASSSRRSSRCRDTGSRCSRRSPRRRWSSARSWACCRATSSACSRTRASRTPATCCSASSPRTRQGKAAVLFYLLTYAVANLGALGIVALLGTAEHPHDELRDFAGLWKTRPALAGLMTVFLLSLGGFPPTAGFIGKWYIFSAAVQEGHYYAGHHRRAVERRLGLLLPAHRRHDVHDGRGRRPRRGRAVSTAAMAGLGLAMLATFYLGVLPDARPRLRAAVHTDDLLTDHRYVDHAESAGRSGDQEIKEPSWPPDLLVSVK